MDLRNQPSTNYHNALVRLKDHFDPVMKRMRVSYEETNNTGWFLPCLLKVLPDIKGIWNTVRTLDFPALAGKVLTTAPILALALGPILTDWAGVTWVWGAVAGTLLFVTTFLRKLWKMSIPAPENKDFHIAAYRLLRKEEYRLFSGSFLFSDFSFEGLNHYLTPLLLGEGQQSAALEQAQADYQSHTKLYKEWYEKELRDRQKVIDSLSEQIRKQEESQEGIKEDAARTFAQLDERWLRAREATRLAIQLLDLLTTRLYRLHNGVLGISDLQLIAPFTLYRLRGRVLEKIADIGTTGKSEATIPIHSKRYQSWATIQVLKDRVGQPSFNEPRTNYAIISYRLAMENGEVWVYNLHVDTTSNKNALDMTIHGIIDPTKFHRIVHVICLLLQKQGYPKKDGVRHAHFNRK